MDKRLAGQLLKFFPNAPLPTRVIIAVALYAASRGGLTPEEEEKLKEMWARAIKVEIQVEKIADLYSRGLADYTSTLREYGDIAVFIAKTLAEALRH